MDIYILNGGSITPTSLTETQIDKYKYPYVVIGTEEGETEEFGWCTIKRDLYYCSNWKEIKNAFLHWLNEENSLYFSLSPDDITEDVILEGFHYDCGAHDFNSEFHCILEKR